MQEFTSVSASSYDPAALATKLTEKSAEGWSVVSIVPTGGDVTAFLSRESSGAAKAAEAAPAEAAAPAATSHSRAPPVTTANSPQYAGSRTSATTQTAPSNDPATTHSPRSTPSSDSINTPTAPYAS